MLSRRKLPLRIALAVSLAAFGVSAQAIVATTGSSTPVDTAYSYVGYVDSFGGSAVAVGPHTFLTAGHVFSAGSTSQTITMGGVAYAITDPNATIAAPDILVTDPTSPQYGQMTHVDLTLVTVSATLPGYYSIGTGLTSTAVTMVGYGRTGGVATDGSGNALNYYNVGQFADGNRHVGTNTVDFAGDRYVAPGSAGLAGMGGGPFLYSLLHKAGDAAAGVGDSGGGWFQGNTLVGISDIVVKANNASGLQDYGFASNNGGNPYFGTAAIDLTDPRLRSFLALANPSPVPEPAPLAALGIGALAVLRRRRR